QIWLNSIKIVHCVLGCHLLCLFFGATLPNSKAGSIQIDFYSKQFIMLWSFFFNYCIFRYIFCMCLGILQKFTFVVFIEFIQPFNVKFYEYFLFYEFLFRLIS